MRVLKLARQALEMLGSQITKKRNPLIINLNIYLITLFAVVMMSSSLMYYTEGALYSPQALADGQAALDATLQPGDEPQVYMPHDPISGNPITEDKRFFSSIPTAMWWSVVTLTTTGYGDMYPSTVLGRIVAAFTMFAGLILFSILMNIVGKTIMVLLFGETLDNQEQKDASADQKLGAQARDNPRATAIVLLEKDQVLTPEEAAALARRSAREIREALLPLVR